MADRLRCAGTWLLVGDQRIAVEADLGLFLPDRGAWGGFLRQVPGWMADTVQETGARLRMPTGQERRTRPLAIPDDETPVPFHR
ncbi:hypothetical protein ACFVP3_37190 [Streptomyces sp. NPDC057806]|uniref:hypothetical protein n=1 Tax=Streptomyces sp. NPDC057806 TaxID=3346255 RepID=UPI0036866A03